MDFNLGEEDQLLRDTVRELCEQTVRPHAAGWDEARALPPAVLGQLGEMGLLAMEQPEADGGAGLSTVAATALVEELAAADGSLALVVCTHNFLGLAHAASGLVDSPRAALLPPMIEGEQLVAWAMAGANGEAPQPGTLCTRARRDGDGWVLDGEQRHVVGARMARHLVVVATVDDAADPSGAVALLVDTDAEGLTVGAPIRTLGLRAAGTAHVTLRGVQVTGERRLGEPTDAWPKAQAALDRHRIGVAALACGVGRDALMVATAYAKEREQFGRPIAEFQAIQWKLADMATTLEAAWLLTMQAAWRRDAGLPFCIHASRAAQAACAAAATASSEALQIHGGYGYTREYPVERSLRDARATSTAAQTPELRRLHVAAAVRERFAS